MPKSRILTVPNAAEEKRAEDCVSVSSLGVPKGRRAIVFCGRLEAEKDPFFALHLAKRFEGDPRFFFLVIGTGSLYARIAYAARRLPNVRVVGHLPHGILPPKDAFLMLNCSPVSETACLSLLESFSLGIPALASDIAGNRDLLSRGGGLLYKTKSPEDASRALLRLAENEALYAHHAQAARRVSQARTVSHMCHEYERLYRALSARV